MWKRIFDHLKELNPYPPATHQGECFERYCVIKEGTQNPYYNTNKLGYKLIDIILFVPLDDYTQMEPYANEIREKMVQLKSIRKTGNETPIIEDDKKKAFTMSIEYQLMRKLGG